MTKENTEDTIASSANYGSNQSGTTEETVPTASTCFPRPIQLTCRPVTVEPVMFLVMFSLALSVPLSTQYMWDRFSEDLGLNHSRGPGCGNKSQSLDPVIKVGSWLDQDGSLHGVQALVDSSCYYYFPGTLANVNETFFYIHILLLMH